MGEEEGISLLHTSRDGNSLSMGIPPEAVKGGRPVAARRPSPMKSSCPEQKRGSMMKKKWKCACGYIHDGDEPPENCPKCGAPAKVFTLLDDVAAELVERSRHTNTLHARLIGLGREIEQVCRDGIADDLDPGCVKVFQKTLGH